MGAKSWRPSGTWEIPRATMASGRASEAAYHEDDLPLPAHQAADGVEQGGLAGPVGADEGDDLARPHVASDPAEGGDGAVVGVEVADF